MEDLMEEGQLEFQEGTLTEDATPPAEESAATEEVTEEAAPAEEETQEPPRRKQTAQERIDEITGKYRSTERDRDDWRDAYFHLEKMVADKKPLEPQPGPLPIEPDMSDLPKPKWEDFQTEEDFRAAEIDWHVERKIRKKEIAAQAAAIKEQQKQERQAFEGWLSDAGKKYPDFKDVAMKPYEEGGPAITLEMDQAIRTDPLGHDIAYHLGKNPEESRRIAKLSPIMQIREIGRLSAKLEDSKPKPKTETKAPATTRGATTGAESPSKDPMKLSWKEYEAMRNKQLYG